MPPLSRRAVRARRRPGADRVDGDRGPANEHDRAVAMFDYVDAMLVVGDAPNRDPKRWQDAPGKGFEGDEQRPLASPNVRTLGRLAHGTYQVHMSQLLVFSERASDSLYPAV